MSTSRDNGGWQAEIALWAGANLSSVRDRSKVILIATDYYNGSVVPTGQVAGHEETLMVGWVAEETTDYSVEYSTVNFSIRGPAYWLQKCVGPSTFLESVVGTPLAWTSIENLTMDKVVHHFMYWRSTAMEVMDIYLSNNTRIIGGMSASVGSIWSQIYDTATTRMLSYLCCDRFGRFFMFLDPQLIPIADRTGILTVHPLTTADLADKVSVKRTVTNPISLLEVAGLAQSGSTVMMYMSRAPGSLIYNRWGENNLNDRLVVVSQDDANVLSGMLLAKKNNMYDTVSFTLGQNNKMLDIAPAMYVSYTVSTGDTIRGFSFAAQRFLIKSIRYTITPETGAVTEDLECEGETVGIPGYTVDVPQEPVYDFPPDPPPLDPNDYPVIPDFIFPPLDPPIFIPPPIVSGSNCPNDKPANGPFPLYFNSNWLQNDSSTSLIASAACKIRSGSAVNKTRYELYGDFQSLTFSGASSSGSGTYTSNDSFYTVYGLSGSGVRVATGIHNAVSGSIMRSGYFSGSAAADIKYLEIVAVPDALHPDSLYISGSTATYQPGSVIWGSNGHGCWFSQVGATSTQGAFTRLVNLPIAFRCSGSGADGDYANDWFTVQTVLAIRNTVNGVDVATKMRGVEVAYDPEPARPYWYDFYIDNGTSDIDHAQKYIFPARTNGDTTYKLYGCSGSAGYFNFQNTRYGIGVGNPRQISLMLAWSVHNSGSYSTIKVDNWYVGIVRRASYRLRVTSANIYNTCEVG
jgi:hypothetical protein